MIYRHIYTISSDKASLGWLMKKDCIGRVHSTMATTWSHGSGSHVVAFDGCYTVSFATFSLNVEHTLNYWYSL
jgi:hypothetical protein